MRGIFYITKENYKKSFADFVQADELNPTLKFTHAYIYVASRINDATRENSDDTPKIFENYLKLARLIEDIQGKLFYESKEPDEVAHYTSLDTLKKLVGTTHFRLYNSTYMNDPEEGRIFFDVMKNLSEKSEIDLADMFDDEDGNMPYRSPAYIGSFVKLDANAQKDNKKDKLLLWRTYGKHNGEEAAGGCLIFPREKFAETHTLKVGAMLQPMSTSIDLEGEQSIVLEEQQNSKPPIYEISYINNNKELPKKIANDLSKLAQCLNEISPMIKNVNDKDDSKRKLKQLARELLDGIRFLFKANDYEEEKEVRIIQFRYYDENQTPESNENKQQQPDKIKVDEEQIPPRFYLETPADFLCKEVILGPRARNFQGWQWWIEDKEKEKDKDKKIEVSKSKIKYGNPDS